MSLPGNDDSRRQMLEAQMAAAKAMVTPERTGKEARHAPPHLVW